MFLIKQKKEIEKLLLHSAYDIFNNEKSGMAETESNQFISQDIDSILKRRTGKVVYENKSTKAGGSTFSKASFKETEPKDDVKGHMVIDDPDF